MPISDSWCPIEADLETILYQYEDPLLSLSQAETPAIIFRQAFNPNHCKGLIQRFIDHDLMHDPQIPLPEGARARIDIGTSLGQRGNDKETFLQHAKKTHTLFEHLFDDYDNPVDTLYHALAALATKKNVQIAQEPDGRRYGPAIFRIHYTHHTYKPHIDHVTLREKRFNYAVTRFDHQFAGVLCFQNAGPRGQATQAILHRCTWTPEIQPHIENQTFHDYAAENQIQNVKVDLEPGDLYFFNTRLIHEVPAIEGNDPRIVLAVFIGYSPNDPDIYVWS
ncbi:MAG: hypothetical protein O7G87_02415 [bacterium]|nr:hypothetical protein [bacterium]